MSEFSPSLSLFRAPLSIVWPHVIARMKSRRSYAWNAFILWFFSNALAFAIRENSTQLFCRYSRSELPRCNRVLSSYPISAHWLASQHVWSWRFFFSTWVTETCDGRLRDGLLTVKKCSWRSSRVRDPHGCYTSQICLHAMKQLMITLIG